MTDYRGQEELEEQIRIFEGGLAKERRKVAELEEERLEYASVLANTPLFILIVDEHRRVQKISRAF
jgi:hypothetical protein